MYLANDVIQNSKKKGPEYGREFLKVLPKAFLHIGECCVGDEKTLGSLSRILNIWEERGVYDAKTVKDFRVSLQQKPAASSASGTPADEDLNSNGSDSIDAAASSTAKRKSIGLSDKDGAGKRAKSSNVSTTDSQAERLKLETTIEVNGAVETHIVLNQLEPAGNWAIECT